MKSSSHSASLQTYMKYISVFPLISVEKEHELSDKIQAGCEQSFDELFCSNLKLVVTIAISYHTSRFDIMDFVSEGNKGLSTCVGKFKSDNGSKFSTYSSYWIKRAILEFISRNRTLVRVPTGAFKKLQSIEITQNKLYYEFKRKPTLKEVSKSTGLSEYSVKSHLMNKFTEHSIQGVQEQNGHEQFEIIDTSPQRDIELTYEITDAVNSISDKRKRKLIKMLFGIKPYRKRSRKECTKIFKITTERVRQLELETLRLLKVYCLEEGIDHA